MTLSNDEDIRAVMEALGQTSIAAAMSYIGIKKANTNNQIRDIDYGRAKGMVKN